MNSGLKNIFTPYKEAPRTRVTKNAKGYLEMQGMSITENMQSQAMTTYWRYPTSNHICLDGLTAVNV